jgi:hypothetical protein
MNTEAVAAKLEDQLAAAGRVAASGSAAEPLVDALVTALGPAIRQAALELAEQAAAELGAQLPTGSVDVVLSEGEPSLLLRSEDEPRSFSSEELEARMTVRLPSNLKAALEEAADVSGDSVNSYVLKTLVMGIGRGGRARRIRETLET